VTQRCLLCYSVFECVANLTIHHFFNTLFCCKSGELQPSWDPRSVQWSVVSSIPMGSHAFRLSTCCLRLERPHPSLLLPLQCHQGPLLYFFGSQDGVVDEEQGYTIRGYAVILSLSSVYFFMSAVTLRWVRNKDV
jgi:hypothetical protein